MFDTLNALTSNNNNRRERKDNRRDDRYRDDRRDNNKGYKNNNKKDGGFKFDNRDDRNNNKKDKGNNNNKKNKEKDKDRLSKENLRYLRTLLSKDLNDKEFDEEDYIYELEEAIPVIDKEIIRLYKGNNSQLFTDRISLYEVLTHEKFVKRFCKAVKNIHGIVSKKDKEDGYDYGYYDEDKKSFKSSESDKTGFAIFAAVSDMQENKIRAILKKEDLLKKYAKAYCKVAHIKKKDVEKILNFGKKESPTFLLSVMTFKDFGMKFESNRIKRIISKIETDEVKKEKDIEKIFKMLVPNRKELIRVTLSLAERESTDSYIAVNNAILRMLDKFSREELNTMLKKVREQRLKGNPYKKRISLIRDTKKYKNINRAVRNLIDCGVEERIFN